MKRLWAQQLVLLVFGVACGLALVSCSELGISDGSVKNSATAGIRAVPPTPSVEITSPARASFMSIGQTTIEGRVAAVTSGAAIQSLFVDGSAVPVNPDGTFSTTMVLAQGLNVIRASATDANGRVGTTEIGVLAGDWLPLSQPVPDSLALRLNNTGLDAIASLVDPLVQQIDLVAMTQDPLFDDVLLGGSVVARVDWQNPRLNLLQSRIFGAPDGLHVEVDLDDIYLEVVAAATILGGAVGPEFATIAADAATLKVTLQLGLAPGGRVTAVIASSDVEFTNFRTTFSPSSLMTIIMPLIRSWVEREVEDLLAAELLALGGDLNLSIDQAFSPAVPADLMGTPFNYEIRGSSVTHDTDGLGLSLSFNASTPVLTARGAAAPGSFSTPAMGTPTLGTQKSMSLSIDDDLINRALHVAWAGGALELDQASLAAATAPTTPPPAGTPPSVPMTANELAGFLPEVLLVVDPSAILTLELEAGLPPVFEVLGAPDLAQLSLAELYLSVYADDGSGPVLLTTLALNLKVSVSFDWTPNGLIVTSAQFAQVSVDVIAEPLVKIGVDKLRIALGLLVPPLVPKALNQMGVVMPVPQELSHLTFFGLQASADGASGQRLKIEIDMIR